MWTELVHQPKELTDFIESMKANHLTTYGSFWAKTLELDYYPGEGLSVICWAIRYRKCDKQPKVKVAFIQTEQRLEFNSDLFFTNMGGWRMLWEARRNWSWYYGDCEPADDVVIQDHDKSPQLGCHLLFDEADVKKLIPEVKYCENLPLTSIIKFIKIFRQHPGVELFLKNEKTQFLWSDTRVWNLSKEKQKAIIPYLKKGHSLNDALGLIRYGSNEKMEKIREKNRVLRRLKKAFKDTKYKFNDEMLLEINKYLESQKEGTWLYIDYLDMSRRLHRLKKNPSRGVLFPRCLREQHDNMTAIIKEIDDAKKVKKEQEFSLKTAEAFGQTLKKYATFLREISNNDLEVKMPDSHLFLVDVGNKLDNCVGVNGYSKKMLEGKCLILVIYKGEEPVECCELLPTEKSFVINQLRGKHNQDSEYHEECEHMMNQFIYKVKNQLTA